MDFGELEYFESYSSYKKKCLAVLGSDRGRIRQFLQHLRNSNDRDEHLLKINVVWDTNSVARELILNDSGKVISYYHHNDFGVPWTESYGYVHVLKYMQYKICRYRVINNSCLFIDASESH